MNIKIKKSWLLVIRLSIGVAALMSLATVASGDIMERSPSQPEKVIVDDRSDKIILDEPADLLLFNEKEWSVDLFGMYAFEEQKGTYDDGFGAGVGVNYFFNRFVGLGLEGYGWKGDGLISSVGGNLMLRYPIERWRLAPYLIAGIGGNFDADNTKDQVNASGGLGMEYRLNKNWGVFTDSRYVMTDVSNDYVITRLGVRFSF